MLPVYVSVYEGLALKGIVNQHNKVWPFKSALSGCGAKGLGVSMRYATFNMYTNYIRGHIYDTKYINLAIFIVCSVTKLYMV